MFGHNVEQPSSWLDVSRTLRWPIKTFVYPWQRRAINWPATVYKATWSTMVYLREVSGKCKYIKMKCLNILTKSERFFYRISCWTIYLQKSKRTYLTLSISRQNLFIRPQSTVRRVRMHCILLFSVDTLPLLSTSSPYGKEEVVQNIIMKMCFYVQPQTPKTQRALRGNKKIQNGFIIHNKCRNVKHTTQLKQLTL